MRLELAVVLLIGALVAVGCEEGANEGATAGQTSGGTSGVGGTKATSNTTTSSGGGTGGAAMLPNCLPGEGAGEQFKDLVYSPVHERHRLDLFLPKESGPVPLIIWIHGGGWKGGSKSQLPAALRPFMKRGYAVASVEYRLSDHDWPAPVVDVKAAVRWLRANASSYGLDPERFGAWGSSAGGHLVAMLGLSDGAAIFDDAALGNLQAASTVQAVVNYYGPAELLSMDADAQANGCPSNSLCHLCVGSPESLLIDCETGLENCASKAKEASPIRYVDQADAPFVIVHGAKDCTVPTPQSQRLHEALTSQGVESQLIVVPDAGHNIAEVSTPESLDAIYRFFDRTLRSCTTSDSPLGSGQGGAGGSAAQDVDACQAAKCGATYAACKQVDGCMDVEFCIRGCAENKQASCVAMCTDKLSKDVYDTHKALFQCAKSKGCYQLL